MAILIDRNSNQLEHTTLIERARKGLLYKPIIIIIIRLQFRICFFTEISSDESGGVLSTDSRSVTAYTAPHNSNRANIYFKPSALIHSIITTHA